MTDTTNPTEQPTTPPVTDPNAATVSANTATDVASAQASNQADASVPLTSEQHETLLAKIEELPEDIAHWVKKVIAEAKALI